ncbi:hypothetical protein CCR80_11900 [Rhodothalassium salexigens]|uniref:M16 family metallopeptidase n=1 Tax=Rhodothalassium salexigens TaxID=1086 RepID=UPI00191157DD|nr:M16 family metallopeptidase [Rhodothalassium salexigens]MBK5921735.1 hypothetical protein [Rhodothalassium salexigens]
MNEAMEPTGVRRRSGLRGRWAAGLVLALGLAWTGPVGAASAAADDAGIAPPPWPRTQSELTPDPGVRYGELDNGLRYAIVANEGPEGQASVRLHMRAGSMMEAADQRGLAHFLEHMAFNGSENVPEGEFTKMLERLGLKFGPDTNASTGPLSTAYMLELPEVGEETLSTALMLMRELADRLTLAEDAIDRERGVVLSERRVRNTPQRRYTQNLFDFLVPGTKLPAAVSVGDPEVLENAGPERFRAFYDGFYTPQRAFLVIAGDIDPDAIEARIETRFADWTQPEAAAPNPDFGTPDPVQPTPQSVAGYFHDPDIPTIVSLSMVKPYEARPDSAETRRQALLRQVANGIVSRRFARLARAEDAQFVQGSAGYGPLYRVAERAAVTVVAEPDTWRDALMLAEQQLRAALQYGVTEAEIDEQLANIRTALKNAVDSAETRRNAVLASGVMGAYHGRSVFTHPETDLTLFEAAADTVTPEAVVGELRAMWQGGMIQAHLATSQELENPAQAILAALRQSAQVEVTPPEGRDELSFAYTDFGAPGEVVARDTVEDLDFTQVRFANNVMLNVKRTDIEKGKVLASVRFGGGILSETPDQAGIDSLVSLGFVAGGLGAHSLDDLQRLMAGRNVGVQLGSGEDAFGYRSLTTPDDLMLQLQLWTAFMTDPAYRPEAEAQYLRTIAAVYDTLDATPGRVMQTRVEEILTGDQRLGLPSRDALDALSLDDLKAHLDPALERGAIEVNVVGDIDPDAVIEQVARTFGALDPRPADFADHGAGWDVSFPEPGRTTLTHAGAADQALVRVYWPAFDDEDLEKVRHMTLLSEVFQLRMTDKIREELGASYSPQTGASFSDAFDGFGYVFAGSEVDTADLDATVAVIEEIAADLARGTVEADELQRARQPILESLEEARANENGYWINVLERSQTDPDDLTAHRQAEAHYESATVADLNALAKTYLVNDSAHVVAVVPGEGAGGDAGD